MEPEIPRGGMGKESLAREVLRVDVQLGGACDAPYIPLTSTSKLLLQYNWFEASTPQQTCENEKWCHQLSKGIRNKERGRKLN
jgi:hypothetical protein